MWPLAVQIAEREDGFECPDEAFDAIFAPLDRGVAGSRHLYDAMAPLVGVLVSEPPADLGRGVSLVRADVGDIAAGWPEASLLVPPGFGGEPDRRCALAVTLELDPGERPPRLAELVEDAVRALRLVSGAAVATGPVGFERIDGGPRPPVALTSASSHHVAGRLLPLRPPPARGRPRDRAAHRRARPARPAPRGARAVRARAAARGPAAGRRAARRARRRAALGALARAHGAARGRAGRPRCRRAPARARSRRRRHRARRRAGRGRPPRAARPRARRAGRPTRSRPRPIRCCWARARARTSCRRASPTCRASAAL